MDAFSGNAIVTGEEGAGTVNLAKGLIKAMQASDSNFSGKVAKITANVLTAKDVLLFILACIVINIFFCCISLMIRLGGFAHKLIILAFLLIVAVFLVLIFLNSFMAIPLMDLIPKVLLWPVLFVYGSICLIVGIRMLTVRDFVAK